MRPFQNDDVFLKRIVVSSHRITVCVNPMLCYLGLLVSLYLTSTCTVSNHRVGLEAHIASLSVFSFISLTETFLTKLFIPILNGYVFVFRLYRRSGKNGGGIALFARADIAAQVIHIADSDVDERSWHIIHVDTGPILFGFGIVLW